MSINIKATNMELTSAISDYVNKRVASLEKFAKGNDEMACYVEVGKTTNHHKQGEFYRAEFNLDINGDKFYAESEKEDLYAAIDAVREDIYRKITSTKDRKETLFKRGARSVKKMIKGLSKRNPFTSKYPEDSGM
ncbi:MAG: ribosome-associated translation inhibitor RaiA [bacterium]